MPSAYIDNGYLIEHLGLQAFGARSRLCSDIPRVLVHILYRLTSITLTIYIVFNATVLVLKLNPFLLYLLLLTVSRHLNFCLGFVLL